MRRHAFTMRLRPGCADEYRRRHETIWPEVVELLRRSGVRDYSIYLVEGTDTLFAVQTLGDDGSRVDTSQDPVMRRWWTHMADLMLTHADGSPVTTPLVELFRLE